MPDERIPLSDAIADLRQELTTARETGEAEELKFRLGEVKLEFQVEMTREASAEAGVKFWVVSVGGTAGLSRGETNTVTVTLVPQVRDETGAWRDAVIGSVVTSRPPLPGSK